MDRMLRYHIGVMLSICVVGIGCLLFNGDVIDIITNIVSVIKNICVNAITSDNIATVVLIFMGLLCMLIMFAFFMAMMFIPSPSNRIENENDIDWKRNG